MAVKMNVLASLLEEWMPRSWSEAWDNSGLQISPADQIVRRVLVALDATESVLKEAQREKADLIIAHHPLIFTPLHALGDNEPVERLVRQFIRSGIGLYVLHSNLDKGLMSKEIARRLKLENCLYFGGESKNRFVKLVVFIPWGYEENVRTAIFSAGAGTAGNYQESAFMVPGTGTFRPRHTAQPFIGQKDELSRVEEIRLETIVPVQNISRVLQAVNESHPYEEVAMDVYPLLNEGNMGLGVIGEIFTGVDEEELIAALRKAFSFNKFRIVPGTGGLLERIAIVPGKGGKLLQEAINRNAQAFISADLDYHQAMLGQSAGLLLLDIGHFAMEAVFKNTMVQELQEICKVQNLHLDFILAENEGDPFQFRE